MNKTELINEVAEKACITKKATEMVINALVGSITEALAAGDKVSIIGFGTFEVKERKAREGMKKLRLKATRPLYSKLASSSKLW